MRDENINKIYETDEYVTRDVVHIEGDFVVVEEDPVDDRAERGRVRVDVRRGPEYAMRNGKILRLGACIAGKKTCSRWVQGSLETNLGLTINKYQIKLIFRVNEDKLTQPTR